MSLFKTRIFRLLAELERKALSWKEKLWKIKINTFNYNTIIIRFVSFKKRDEILNKVRTELTRRREHQKNLTGLPLITEHLIAWPASLLHRVKEELAHGRLKACWIRNGKVFNFRDQLSSPQAINSVEDLEHAIR